MIKARGLNHINLNVSDIDRSLKFYQDAFGLEVDFWEGKTMVFLHSPGARDTITLCQAKAGEPVGNGGVSHFGFSFGKDSLDEAVSQIENAGGKLLNRGKHGGKFPFVLINESHRYH